MTSQDHHRHSDANFITLIGDTVGSDEVGTGVGLTGTAGGIAGMLSSLVVGLVVDHSSFMPVFAVSALLYPAAWLILAAVRRGAAVRVEVREQV